MPLTKYSDIAKATNEEELLAAASRHLQVRTSSYSCSCPFFLFHLQSLTSTRGCVGIHSSAAGASLQHVPADPDRVLQHDRPRHVHSRSWPPRRVLPRSHFLGRGNPSPLSFAGAALQAWPNRACERHQMFVFPSYNLRLPEVTRTLLLYRFYRLDAARDRAKQVLDPFTYTLMAAGEPHSCLCVCVCVVLAGLFWRVLSLAKQQHRQGGDAGGALQPHEQDLGS